MDKKQEKISKMIINYLQNNPHAGDTLEGITKWWLELERIEYSVDEVSSVLENLVRMGFVKEHKVKDGLTFYKSNHE